MTRNFKRCRLSAFDKREADSFGVDKGNNLMPIERQDSLYFCTFPSDFICPKYLEYIFHGICILLAQLICGALYFLAPFKVAINCNFWNPH